MADVAPAPSPPPPPAPVKSVSRGTVVLKLADFPAWFEEKLSANLKVDLSVIKILLNEIRGEVSELCRISAELRQNHSAATPTPQVSRIVKLCDQIDALFSLYGQEHPKLPGSTYLADLAQKLRNRLKTVDDMASSSKLVRTDPLVAASLSAVRGVIVQINSTIASLEGAQRQQQLCTDYIDAMHVHVLDPILALGQQNVSLSANQDTQQIMSAAKSVSEAEDTYKDACRGSIFVKVMTLKREAEQLQAALDDMLTPLREVTKNEKVVKAFSKMEGISWHRNLVNMLSCSMPEMLKHCRFSNTLDVFCDALVQFLKLIARDFFDLSSVSPEARTVAAVCSAEELATCLRRWRFCDGEADAIVASSEYSSALKDLIKLRQQLKMAEQEYDAKVKLHATSVAKYNDVYGQMVSMRGVLMKICAVDLGVLDLSIILPQETATVI